MIERLSFSNLQINWIPEFKWSVEILKNFHFLEYVRKQRIFQNLIGRHVRLLYKIRVVQIEIENYMISKGQQMENELDELERLKADLLLAFPIDHL